MSERSLVAVLIACGSPSRSLVMDHSVPGHSSQCGRGELRSWYFWKAEPDAIYNELEAGAMKEWRLTPSFRPERLEEQSCHDPR